MEKASSAGKALVWPAGAVLALATVYVVGRVLLGKHMSHRNAPTCERCQKNPVRLRIDQMHGGRRESRFLCQSCADELMNTRGSRPL